MASVLIEVYGRVQGVNFRVMTKKFADSLGVRGCVMNRTKGSVLIHAQGAKESIKKLILWIKGSPGLSSVDRVVVRKLQEEMRYNDFTIVREGFFKDQVNSFGNLGRRLFGEGF